MGSYSAVKKELRTTWTNLHGYTLDVKGQSKKVTHFVIPFVQHFWKGNILEMESRLVFARTQQLRRLGKDWCCYYNRDAYNGIALSSSLFWWNVASNQYTWSGLENLSTTISLHWSDSWVKKTNQIKHFLQRQEEKILSSVAFSAGAQRICYSMTWLSTH